MPYLRFSKDKRGYENTYVFHTPDGGETARPRMLYWFRSPPNLQVGRPPLDEEAIRSIEAHNPDVSFDWTKILKAQAQTQTQRPRPPHRAAGPGGERRRRGAAPAGPARGATPPPRAGAVDEPAPTAGAGPEPVALDADRDSTPGPVGEHPVLTLMGAEALERLRARYTDLQARISEADAGPTVLAEIRARVERLDPDRWTGIEDAVTGIERFDREVAVIDSRLQSG